jgi:hypothetical protein
MAAYETAYEYHTESIHSYEIPVRYFAFIRTLKGILDELLKLRTRRRGKD